MHQTHTILLMYASTWLTYQSGDKNKRANKDLRRINTKHLEGRDLKTITNL